jgi:predicted dithiol-disulfide oxidoreductase (DUF899 family)
MPDRATSAPQHAVRFPNESAAYRAARTELLEAEIALRAQLEAVAALRRALPLGGEVAQDYVFEEGARELDHEDDVSRVRLSELFARDATLVVYSFMYGPDMARACPMCTSMLDGLNGNAPHIAQQVNLAVVAKSPLARIRAYARERGWRNLRLLSSHDNTYNRDYQGESASGAQMPALNVFVRRDGKVYHFYNSELLFAPAEPGMHPRHVDLLWPLWNMFDLTPEGRGKDWYPKLAYP